MYLKSIEVHGFKSFANKLKFDFREGITGIVGPNGSGKSNVADAVRWVLGEQSAKQLRSGSMQDVIFAGTQMRKPQSFASVAITFDNSDHRLDVDYEEVTVTRRIYRSGESEYLINNTAVRLKDINEIFYDTGIGQEGYSIIGQGQIDRILSARSEERRELFDEAAGIVKFKKRKRAAVKKLEDEHQNLQRVTDILNELTSQLGPLKRQYETAKVYLEKRDRLRALDINLFILEESRLEAELSEAVKKIRIAENDTAETKDELERTKQEYEDIERELTEIREGVTALVEQISKNAVVRQQLSGQVELLKEQINTIEASGAQMEQRFKQITDEIETRRKEKDRLFLEGQEAEILEADAAKRENEERAKLEAIDLEIEQTEAAIEQAKNDLIVSLQNRSSVKGKIQRYDAMLEQLEIRRSEINGRLLRIHEEIESAQKTKNSVTETIALMEEAIQVSSGKQRELESKIAQRQKELADLNTRLDAASAGFHGDSSKLESLKAMAERYDGYGLAIKKIMDMKKRNAGIRGVVADLIDVPENYETAIETALGGSIRNVVTDNESTAKYMIEYLKSNKLGRATFLPLTSIKARPLNDRSVLNEQGVVGTASSLVSTESEYQVLVEHLLGRIVVIDHIDNAIRIGRKYRHSIFMVTLQGESFAPGGSITGGAFKSTENLLGRKREIEELTESSKRLRKETEELRVKIDQIRNERNQLRDQLTAESSEEQKLKLRLNTVQMSSKQADEQIQVGNINKNALDRENDEIERQIQEVKDKSSGIRGTLRASEDSETAANETASRMREKEDALRSSREEEAALLEKIHLESSTLVQQREFRKETLERLDREMESLKREGEVISGGLCTSDEETDAKHAQIAEVEAAIARADEDTKKKETEKAALSEKEKSLSESHKDFFERRDNLSERLTNLDRELYRLNAQKERMEEGREDRVNYMWDEYNLTPSEVRAQKSEEYSEDRAQVRRDIGTLKKEIKGLGNVNVNAIEEYKSVSERHEFLSAQHEDLIRSEDSLTGIITSLDQGMRKQFSEKFAIIKEEFDKAFKELFGGGSGAIEIDPNEDLLEAGISIIAHPPGKKLQNMMQLSGGEKALTAIALLFAIQNMKPSPFCLLDEIEAALDESNVIRFAEYLHNLTKNTQFIVITHRRGTMNAADRLYGITMQEKGVSTLVSVNLIEEGLTG